MMRSLRSLSVAAQVTLIIMGVTVLALATYFSIANVIDGRHARESLRQQGQMLARIAAEYNVSELAFRYGPEAEANLDKLLLLPEIETVQIYDTEGRLFATRERPVDHPCPHPETIQPNLEAHVEFTADHLEIFQPMVFREQRYGTLRLTASTTAYQALLQKRLRLLFLCLGLVMALVIPISVVAQRWISGPIHDLIDKVRAIAGGDLSIRAEVEVSDGEIASLCQNVNVMADALERRIHETENARQMLQVVSDRIPAGIYWKNPDSVYVWSNRQFARDAGLEHTTDIVGKTDADLPWKENAELSRVSDRQIIENDSSHLNVVQPMLRSDGSRIWIDASKVPLHDAGGRVIGILGSYIDITRRKLAEDAHLSLVTQLKEASARYDAMVKASNTGAWEYARDTGVLWCSPEYFSMLGRESVFSDQKATWSLDAMLGLVHPEERELVRRTFYDYLEKPHGLYQQNFRMQHRDGRWIWILSRGQTLRDPQGNPTALTVGIHIDITDRIQLEEQVRHSEKMKAIGQLAGGIAHDFNNQLTGILGSAELLLLKSSDPALRSHAQCIRTAGLRSSQLVKQLLAFARKGQVTSTPVNMHHLLAEVVGLLQHSIDRRIMVVQQLEAQFPTVLGDPSQLQSTLLNLAINARDAMPEGGTLTFTTRHVVLENGETPKELEPGTYLVISIADTGHGMSREVQARVFEPFFTTKKDGKGTGLGLAAVYGTIKAHNGFIDFQSEVGQGTTFQILLPLARQHAPDLVGKAPAISEQPAQGSVLLVDDEELIRITAGQMLETLGYRVTACSDGYEALTCLEGSEFDLAVIDLMMPMMSGTELIEAIRRLRPKMKILVVSGYRCDATIDRLLSQWGVGFLGKPFQLDELTGKLEALQQLTQPPIGSPVA